MLTTLRSVSLAVLILPGSATAWATQVSVEPCRPDITDLRNLVESWDEKSLRFEGDIRAALVDAVEPACCSKYLVLLSPDPSSELGERACFMIGLAPETGFVAVDIGSLEIAIARDQALELTFAYSSYDPDTGTSSPRQSAQVIVPSPGAGQAAADAPISGGDRNVAARLYGSWIPAVDSGGRADVYTFNPDGTRTISDGSGMNLVDSWALENGQLTIDGRPIELEFDGYDILLSGARLERFALHGETYEGRYLQPGIDPYGFYVPTGNDVTLGHYALHHVHLLPPEEFAAFDHGKATLPPIEARPAAASHSCLWISARIGWLRRYPDDVVIPA